MKNLEIVYSEEHDAYIIDTDKDFILKAKNVKILASEYSFVNGENLFLNYIPCSPEEAMSPLYKDLCLEMQKNAEQTFEAMTKPSCDIDE